MTKKVNITDRALKALKAAPAGQTYDLWDAIVPGLGVRVAESGRRTFVLLARFGGAKNPTRRAIGVYGAISLDSARQKARDWLELVRAGKDPSVERERSRLAEQTRRANTFTAIAEDFITEKLSGERRGAEAEQDIRREFIPVWGKRPITDLTDLDVLAVINAKKKDARVAARNLLALAKRLFQWTIDQRVYGLKSSPADGLKPGKIIGERASRGRVLSDVELFALWRATGRMRYPHGAVYRVLMLTALRLNEAADAARQEFDWVNRLWTISALRMKGRNGKAQPHAVPLTDDLLAILESLPRFKKGEYLFSTTMGESPAWMTDKIKKRVDERMLHTLKALAKKRGEDPASVELSPWTNHDIRRTVRSGLSRLKISEEAREAVLAHARPGIKGVYDVYDYLDEKREALELWADRLRQIVTRS